MFNGLSLTRVLSDLTPLLSISSATLFQREAGPAVFDQACQTVFTQAALSSRSELDLHMPDQAQIQKKKKKYIQLRASPLSVMPAFCFVFAA